MGYTVTLLCIFTSQTHFISYLLQACANQEVFPAHYEKQLTHLFGAPTSQTTAKHYVRLVSIKLATLVTIKVTTPTEDLQVRCDL